MSATASFTAQAATQGCNWLFADPYAYQYSEISGHAAGSAPSELEGSTPDIMLSHAVDVTGSTPVELEGSSGPTFVAELDAGRHLVPYSEIPKNSPLKKSSSLVRNRFSTARHSLKHPHVRGNIPTHSDLPEVVPEERPTTHICPSGLMPAKQVPAASLATPPPAPYTGIISPDASGLILANEGEPGTDFDSILRNIGPISKKRRNCGPSRASRYYDRFETNAG
ncbi:hypothetical protein F5X96DRAFT_621111 [Biscogniauxia mediterranea]|nr:hypothetical protein F5X96DRAFT_621111 [Biscogniauxia mediterranea]